MIKVVVVDDDSDLLQMVCLLLHTSEIRPVCIEDCKNVMAVLDTEMPDVLVMDIFLGECDGRSLCRQVKSMEKYASLPILLYSAGYISQDTIAESGADDFLAKPFDTQTLLSRIQQLANRN